MKSLSVKDLFEMYGGTAPGFDALRLILSVIVLGCHSVVICHGLTPITEEIFSDPFMNALVRGVLPAFFFLGGFLVTGSAYRLREVKKFLMYRILRIFPALLVEVTLSAVILGALVTQLPLVEYYLHSEFYSYFLNIIGVVHFYLPGVFKGHPVDVVNVNLWTLPPDFYSYAVMAVLMMAGIIYTKKVFLPVFMIGTAFVLLLLPGIDWGKTGMRFVHPYLLIYSFFLGAFCHVFASRIRIAIPYMLLSAVATVVFFNYDYTIFLGVLTTCYFTLCIGFLDLRSFPLVKQGDYSYGIYLYGYPIEQALWHYLPVMREWWVLFPAALAAALVFSALSWHLIEKPFLGLKRKFK